MIFIENPEKMTMPEPTKGIVRIFLLIAPCVMPDMICAPFIRGILQCPSAGDQQNRLDPRPAFKTSMGDQTVITNGDAQTRSEIEQDGHRPINPGVADVVPEQRDGDDRAEHNEREQR